MARAIIDKEWRWDNIDPLLFDRQISLLNIYTDNWVEHGLFSYVKLQIIIRPVNNFLIKSVIMLS